MSCNKIPYASRADAGRSCDKLKLRRAKPYVCKFCGQWHITTADARTKRQTRKRLRLAKNGKTIDEQLIAEFVILKRSEQS